MGKETGLTSYIERFNNTLRQRVSRLVRKTFSLSKLFASLEKIGIEATRKNLEHDWHLEH